MTTESLLPSVAGLQEPNLTIQTANTEIILSNNVAPGLVAAIPAPVTTSGTTANTILSLTTIPAAAPVNAGVPSGLQAGSPNSIGVGQAYRITVAGVNSADANAKTVTINYGASGTAAWAVTASGATWFVEAIIQNVGTVASPKWWLVGIAQQAATAVAAASANGTDAQSSSQTLQVQLTAATAGTMTANVCMIEVIR